MKRVGIVLAVSACSAAQSPMQQVHASRAPLSLAADERMILIPAGRFIAGSTLEERAAAYDSYLSTTGNDTARTHRWFEREADRHGVLLPAFRIDLMPVTQAQYAEFVAAEQVAAPSIDEAGWRAQGFAQDFAAQVARFAWSDGRPPAGREDHPVVLVTWSEADRYCAWRGRVRGQPRRLPTSDELEKATRGESGLAYPWGNTFESDKLNSAVQGPGDTTPVGSYSSGASPYGVLDLAGNVFHWTATSAGGDEFLVKGSGWTEHGGIGRGASVDKRARSARHVVIGFRCASDAS